MIDTLGSFQMQRVFLKGRLRPQQRYRILGNYHNLDQKPLSQGTLHTGNGQTALRSRMNLRPAVCPCFLPVGRIQI